MRSPRTATKSSPRSPQLEKARAQQRRPNTAKNSLINYFIFKKSACCIQIQCRQVASLFLYTESKCRGRSEAVSGALSSHPTLNSCESVLRMVVEITSMAKAPGSPPSRPWIKWPITSSPVEGDSLQCPHLKAGRGVGHLLRGEKGDPMRLVEPLLPSSCGNMGGGGEGCRVNTGWGPKPQRTQEHPERNWHFRDYFLSFK